MKKQLYTSLLVATVMTSSLGTANAFAAPMVHPEQVQNIKSVDLSQFSSSFRKLGEQAALLQAYALIIENQPAFNLPQVPALQDVQQLIQGDMKEWRGEILNKRLLRINESNRNFVRTFDTYVEHENLEVIPTRLGDKMEKQQINIQQTLNELEELKTSLGKHKNNLTTRIQEADKFLNGGSGRIAELKKGIGTIQASMQKDLDVISSVPGILVNSGTTIGSAVWKLLYPVTKGGTQAALEYVAAAAKKLEEAKKAAIEKAKKDGTAEVDIERIMKEIEENFANTPEGKSLTTESLKKYDFMDKVDIEQIKKIIEAEALGSGILQKQKDAIVSLAEKNNQLYTATRDLQTADIQALQLLLIESKVSMFEEQVDTEMDLLKKHQKDWVLIEQAIKELPETPTSSDLKTLKALCKQLDEQIKSFDNVVKG
ncbi:HBL/NHE enterotoxin family protein [Bacillus cereus group sp. N6]|uniref:HBL/NHE enterotoxin family protein n=1 Tax=Bacillus cereus group sp. N6 TaxID=2794583 RepID=UPI0018F4A309|nr:HBL/NHE enterotoxin family protein [Bacillus cereus group sp. N6]MBJ8113534.1 HBL/NHE enterotoxin family protein [Bacillus cereus group sp. N6]